MMPVVRISDATFADLSSIAKWLRTDTPSNTIDAIVRQTMERLGMERDDEPQEATTDPGSSASEFKKAPGLAFTKPLKASVGGQNIGNPRWSAILLATISAVRDKGFHGDALIEELAIPARTDGYEDEGFKFSPDLGISIQGQSASDAWKEISRLANKWHIPVAVEFQWRQNPKAQYAGRKGVLRAG